MSGLLVACTVRTLQDVDAVRGSSRRGRPPGADGAETRHRILHSARRVFSSVGFDRASLKEIAEDAGLTRNAIANYYPNKVELHRAAFASIEEEAINQILAQASLVEGPIEKRLFAVFETATQLNRVDDSFVRFLITSTVDGMTHPELRDSSARRFVALGHFLEDAVATARRRGEVAADIDATAAAQLMVNLLWGLAIESALVPNDRRLKRNLAVLEGFLGKGLRPL